MGIRALVKLVSRILGSRRTCQYQSRTAGRYRKELGEPLSLSWLPSIEEKFAPKSIATNEVFKRLSAILPDFTKEHESFGIIHAGRRNTELHSGEIAFDGIKGSVWQPRFYKTCEILLSSMGMNLADFLGSNEANVAKQLITAAADESAKAVKGDVDAHKKVWFAKSETDRATLATQASVWATRQAAHRVDCPACGSRALVAGEPVAPARHRIIGGEVNESQDYLPAKFECVACGLKISGLSRLTVVGLGDRYTRTIIYNPLEYYGAQDELAEYEEDNNEP